MWFILHTDVHCFPPGDPVSVLSSSSNQTTVEREVVEFSCTFKGNYSLVNYDGVYWMVIFQNGSNIILHNNISNYHFEIQQNSLCHFTTKLYINTSMSLDNAMVTCTVMMNNILNSSNATSYLSESPIVYISIHICIRIFNISISISIYICIYMFHTVA